MAALANVELHLDTFNSWRIKHNVMAERVSSVIPSANTVSANEVSANSLDLSGHANLRSTNVRGTANLVGSAVNASANASFTGNKLTSTANVVVGHSSPVISNKNGQYAVFQVVGSGSSNTGFGAILRYSSTNDLAPALVMGKSANGTAGTLQLVGQDDVLGEWILMGANNTGWMEGARLRVSVDGTPQVNSLPTKIEVSVTPVGAITPTTRLTLRANGHVAVAGSLSLTRNATITGNLVVDGTGTFNGARNTFENANTNVFSDTLNITANTNIKGNVNFTGSTFTGINSVPTGAMLDFAGNTAPSGYLLCDGASYATADHPALFAVIGYTWGGSGANFNVPDMRRRVSVGSGGTGSGELANTVGSTGGEETHALTSSELAAHTHTFTTSTASAHTHTFTTSTASEHTHTASTASSGGHDHGGATGSGGSHSHTTGTNGDHRHMVVRNAVATSEGLTSSTAIARSSEFGGDSEYSLDQAGTSEPSVGKTSMDGDHTHTVSTASAHTHGISGDGTHTHTVTVNSGGAHNHTGTSDSGGSHSHTGTTASTGSGTAHNIMQPSAVVTKIIKT